ncbi:MAG: type II toxin-antitoxin system VapC family toxin [Pleurocapsa sp. SU_196_0]|nr:type II toxin-antitoxin system VapC family toxin [Pleurocapsa sp. SU_196_0]
MVIDAPALTAVLTGKADSSTCLALFDTPPHATTLTLLEVLESLPHLEPRVILDAMKGLDVIPVEVDLALILEAKRKPLGSRDASLSAALARRNRTSLITLETGQVIAKTI